MQLQLLMNTTEQLVAEVIRKLAIITHQTMQIHLAQSERQRSSSAHLTDDNAS